MYVIQDKNGTMRNVDVSVKNQFIKYPCNFVDKVCLIHHINI